MLENPTFEQKKVISLFRILFTVAALFGVVWLIFHLSPLIPPFLVATIIAMTLIPEVDRMEKHGYRRGVAIGLIYLAFLAVSVLVLMGLNLVLGQTMTLISQHIPEQLQHANSKDLGKMVKTWMEQHHVWKILQPTILTQTENLPTYFGKFVAAIPTWAGSLIWVILVPIITFFILMDFDKILGKMLIMAPADRREGILKTVKEITFVFGKYVRGVLTVMALDIVIIYFTLLLMGFHSFALPLAVAAGILYTIPYFGAFTSTVVIGIVGWINPVGPHGPTHALAVTGLMVLIHQVIFDNIVAPRVIGGSINMHPLLTLLSLMAGGALFGIGGVLLAVPVAAAMQVVVVQIFPQLKTDVVAMRRAVNVVQTTIAAPKEAVKPEQSLDSEAVKAEAKRESQPLTTEQGRQAELADLPSAAEATVTNEENSIPPSPENPGKQKTDG